MLNAINIIGRLVRDPELRKTTSGISVCSFTIANSRKLANGKEETWFFDVETWNGTAEFVDKYFEKGKPIVVTGYIKTRNYEDNEGNKRKAWTIVASTVDFVPGEKKPSQAEEYIPADDEIPF